MRKPKISHCLLSHYGQKRTRTPFTGRRLSSSGSLSGVSSSRRPIPFVSGQSFLFPMPVVFGFLVIPLPLSVRVFRLELITTSSTRRANQKEKHMMKKTIYVSRCKTAGTLRHRDCWRNQDEAVRQRLGRDSRLAAVAHKGGDDHTPCFARRACCLVNYFFSSNFSLRSNANNFSCARLV